MISGANAWSGSFARYSMTFSCSGSNCNVQASEGGLKESDCSDTVIDMKRCDPLGDRGYDSELCTTHYLVRWWCGEETWEIENSLFKTCLPLHPIVLRTYFTNGPLHTCTLCYKKSIEGRLCVLVSVFPSLPCSLEEGVFFSPFGLLYDAGLRDQSLKLRMGDVL